MNTYKILLVPYGDHDMGDEAELDLTADEESDLLNAGRIEIVPRPYKVIGTSRVNETEPGEVFDGAFRVESEAALIDYGQIERVPQKKTAGKKNKGGDG